MKYYFQAEVQEEFYIDCEGDCHKVYKEKGK